MRLLVLRVGRWDSKDLQRFEKCLFSHGKGEEGKKHRERVREKDRERERYRESMRERGKRKR